MKKVLYLITLFLTVSHKSGFTQVLSASANPKDAANKEVAIAEEEMLTLSEVEYNFGKIPQGKPVTHVFEVKNNGKDSLKISNVQASCGCTTPEWDRDKAVAPGKTTKITVGYNAASEGPFTKFITISFNESKSKQISIKGEVWKTPASSAPENKILENLKEK